jgi:hypothetical protein
MSANMASSEARIRRLESASISADQMADALARAFALWRSRDYARRRDAIAAIARSAGYSVGMLEESIDALLRPFTTDSLKSMAPRISATSRVNRPKKIGFIAAGNVAGAGIHEIAIALLAGAAVVVKTASAEPIFFTEFARTLTEIDPAAGARFEVLHWSRARTDLTAVLLASCDQVVAYGDDATIESLRNRSNVVGFGSRVSAAVAVTRVSDEVAGLLARDVVLFEQLGCLSLHQVFVVGPDDGSILARQMAAALEQIAKIMPRAAIPLRDAVEIRNLRERARWRAIAGEPVELLEGRDLDWTVVFEPSPSPFQLSPGFRTVYVTGVRDCHELRDSIAGLSGRIEAMAIAGDESEAAEIRKEIEAMRIPYICAPGEMQSPPLDWRHGGGMFLDLMVGAR